jgi:hypothetical protein
MKFLPLDRVEKVGGSFQATGVIVAAFKTLDGQERYVFEFDVPKGMLHIYGPGQLEYPKPKEEQHG